MKRVLVLLCDVPSAVRHAFDGVDPEVAVLISAVVGHRGRRVKDLDAVLIVSSQRFFRITIPVESRTAIPIPIVVRVVALDASVRHVANDDPDVRVERFVPPHHHAAWTTEEGVAEEDDAKPTVVEGVLLTRTLSAPTKIAA